MMYRAQGEKGFSHRIYERFHAIFNVLRKALRAKRARLSRNDQGNATPVSKPLSSNRAKQVLSPDTAADDDPVIPGPSPTFQVNDELEVQPAHMILHGIGYEQSLKASCVDDDARDFIDSPNIWSAAFTEAVESLEKEIDIVALKGRNLTLLFRDLEDIGNGEFQDSAFMRGVKCLQSIHVPLELRSLALGVANCFLSFEPTAATVVGVLRRVIALAISFATADLDFAKRIGEMLAQIPYIDDCDTLGQKTKRRDIHNALVPAYKRILEFYEAALEILNRHGTRLILDTILDNDRLPKIIEDFLDCSRLLHQVVGKANYEISADIQEMCYDREISIWLGREKLSQQTSLHASLKVHYAHRTCEFLLKTETFIKWYYTAEPAQLSIIGDMGCGKSVAMAFIQDCLRQRKDHLPQPKICGYHWRDGETGKDVRIFSALLLTLLDQLPGLKKQFVLEYKQAQLDGIYDPAADSSVLKDLLQRMLGNIDRPVIFVIDGLDECDRASRNNVLGFLRILSQTVSEFKSIVSSRPQLDILEQLGRSFRIELGSDTQRDALIVQSAVEAELPHLSADVKALVINSLSHRACGSAIWTKMTIHLIQTQRISASGPMQTFLEELTLPKDLSILYNKLFSRCTSDVTENVNIAKAALKFLCASRRPVSILELTWAATLHGDRHSRSVNDVASQIDCQRVISLICPFITRIDFADPKRHQVRILHQSLKEFILNEWASDQAVSLNSGVFGEEMSHDRRFQELEAFALDICIKCLFLEEHSKANLFSDTQLAIAELPQEFDLFNENVQSFEYNPHCTWETWEEDMIRFEPAERGFGEFFAYASSYWLDSLGSITIESFLRLTDVENLCCAGSTLFHNWTQQNSRPGCTILPRFEFDSNLYDPLLINSLYGSKSMLAHMLDNANFENGKYLRQPAMAAADQILRWGDVSRLGMIFFHERIGHQLQNLEFFQLIIRRWYEPKRRWKKSGIKCQNWSFLFDLIEPMSERLTKEKWGRDLLCTAISYSCTPIITWLITKAGDLPELRSELIRGLDDNFEDTALYVAIREGDLAVIDFLIQAGVNLKIRDQNGDTPLHLASESGIPGVAERLLEGSEANAKNHAGKTAFETATERGNHDAARAMQLSMSQ